MMDAIKRLGVAYGKLGISSDPDVIGRRGDGVKAAADALELAGIAPLLRAAFDLGSGDERFAFLTAFSGDPTFDVKASDREAVLLASAVAEYEIENETTHSGVLALAVVTCACGGLRVPALNDQLVPIARKYLAQFQSQAAAKPKGRTYQKQPDDLGTAITAVANSNTGYGSPQIAPVVSALKEVGKYSETVSRLAAQSDQEILGYIGNLEQEMRTYWWVTGGWSDDADASFRRLDLSLAAVCAGKELSDKRAGELGLFAAPALIDLILERGRQEPLGEIPLQVAATTPGRAWRKNHFESASAGPLAGLVPVTAALGLAAASEDADDWKPRFNRLTGLHADAALPAVELAVQLYRERLLARALG